MKRGPTARTRNGDLRLIDTDSGTVCKSGEGNLQWSQQAPQGPQGVQGPAGAQGPQGPQGTAGLTYSTVVTDVGFGDPQIGGFSKAVSCPTGTKVMSGSWQWAAYYSNDPPTQVEREPFGDTEWLFAVPDGSASKGLEMDLAIVCVVAT